MISVDTSVVVRYLVGEPAEQAGRAQVVMEGVEPVSIPVVVLLETAHVLRTQCGVERRDVLDTLLALVTREGLEILGVNRGLVMEALVRARDLPGSPLPDALMVATVRDAGALPLFTFDGDLVRHGISVREP
jgi:predicted nucleic acid-binding protein